MYQKGTTRLSWYGSIAIDPYLPAISWYVLVIMKSAWFIAIKSAVN